MRQISICLDYLSFVFWNKTANPMSFKAKIVLKETNKLQFYYARDLIQRFSLILIENIDYSSNVLNCLISIMQ